MNHQVLYPVLKVVMDLTLHILAAKQTSKTTRLGTDEGKTNQLLRRLTASPLPPQVPRSAQSRTLREEVGGGPSLVAPTRFVRIEDGVF